MLGCGQVDDRAAAPLVRIAMPKKRWRSRAMSQERITSYGTSRYYRYVLSVPSGVLEYSSGAVRNLYL